MDFGKKLKKIRTERHLNEDVVAHSLGISQGAYSNWETGKAGIKLEQVPKLAEAFEMELSTLLQELYGESLVFNNHQQQGGNAANIIVNQLSDKERELYERVISLQDEVILLHKRLAEQGK